MSGIQSRIREAMDLPLISSKELDAKVVAQEKTIQNLKRIIVKRREAIMTLCKRIERFERNQEVVNDLRRVIEQQRDIIYGKHEDLA